MPTKLLSPTQAARQSRVATWAAVLTLAWLVAVPVLLASSFASLFSLGDTPNPQAGLGAVLLLVTAAVGVLLPLTVAVIAFSGRRPGMAVFYLVVAVLLLVPAGLLVVGAAQTFEGLPRPATETPSQPGACQEHTGGDTRCPGG